MQQAAEDEFRLGEAGFLTKGFERFRAERDKQGKANDEANDKIELQESNAEKTPPALSDEVETVLRVFNGTIVKDIG